MPEATGHRGVLDEERVLAELGFVVEQDVANVATKELVSALTIQDHLDARAGCPGQHETGQRRASGDRLIDVIGDRLQERRGFLPAAAVVKICSAPMYSATRRAGSRSSNFPG